MNIYFKRRNREVKTSSSALFISFTEKEIFQFFYQAYPKKKKICRLTPFVKQGAQNYQIIRL